MKPITTSATAMILMLAAPGLALADSDHGHGAPGTAGEAGTMQDMMQTMMKMHGQMMGAGMNPGMMGAHQGGGMGMMDGAMMRMMIDGDMMAAHAAMQARLAEFDADADGALSLAEFEALHAAMIRDLTVDRFQYLDADGDGRITGEEMAAPAQRMERRRMMPGASGETGAETPSGN